MAIQPPDILNGSLAWASIILATLIGIHIISKYFEYKRSVFLFIGLESFLITEPWWPAAISLLVAFFNEGQGLSPEIYFIIGNVAIPFSITVWLIAFTDLMNIVKKKKLIIILSSIIYGIVFEIIFFTLLFINPALIGKLNPPVDVEYRFFVLGFLLSVLLIILITGILFGKESLKSENPEIRLKGKLIIAAFISFVVGALLDTAAPLNPITLIITRLILMSAAIEFWGGFVLPKWMKKLFFKKYV